MAQAAATPNTRLSGTTIAAMMRVSRIALQASGSLMASKNAPRPLRSASVKTAASGRIKNRKMKASAMPISVHFTQAGSLVPALALRTAGRLPLMAGLLRACAARLAAR